MILSTRSGSERTMLRDTTCPTALTPLSVRAARHQCTCTYTGSGGGGRRVRARRGEEGRGGECPLAQADRRRRPGRLAGACGRREARLLEALVVGVVFGDAPCCADGLEQVLLDRLGPWVALHALVPVPRVGHEQCHLALLGVGLIGRCRSCGGLPSWLSGSLLAWAFVGACHGFDCRGVGLHCESSIVYT